MWKKRNDYYIECEGWTIAKLKVNNVTKYALWQGNKNNGYFDSADEAKQRYEELNK